MRRENGRGGTNGGLLERFADEPVRLGHVLDLWGRKAKITKDPTACSVIERRTSTWYE